MLIINLFSEGQIYAVGGHDEQNWTAICERYDPESDKWTKLAPMKFKRLLLGTLQIIQWHECKGQFPISKITTIF